MYDLLHSNGRHQKGEGHLFTVEKFRTSKNMTLFENMFKNVLKKPGREPLLQHTGKAKLINIHVHQLLKRDGENGRRAHGAGTVLQPFIPVTGERGTLLQTPCCRRGN